MTAPRLSAVERSQVAAIRRADAARVRMATGAFRSGIGERTPDGARYSRRSVSLALADLLEAEKESLS